LIANNTLRDEPELDVRIAKARAQMGALKPILQCLHIELITKYMIYNMATPLNTYIIWWRNIVEHNREIATTYERISP